MRPAKRLLVGASLAACVASALADDPPADAPKAEEPSVHGDVRVGWRFLSGENEGLFPQEFGLTDGARLFDLNLLATDPRADAPIDEIEARVSGVGDPYSDCLLAARKRGLFDLSGGYRRDEYDYLATGEPFPYSTTRERTFVHGRWTPNGDFALRFSWDGSDRRGDASTVGYNLFGPSVAQRRTISQESDRFTLGADYAVGIFRFGLAETAGVAHVDDSRFSGTSGAAHDFTSLYADSTSYSTTAKAGVSLLDGKLDATLFLVETRASLDDSADGESRGPFPGTSPIVGEGRLRRDASNWRLESSWRPAEAWELTFAGERDDVRDDQSGSYYLGATKQFDSSDEITDLCQRWSVDATWTMSDQWRFRLGEQYLREEVFVPTDSHFAHYQEPDAHPPTDYSSNALRTTVGVDWNPWKSLSASAIAHVSSDDAPQTTAVPDHSTDRELRVRWKPSDEWSLTTLWRRSTRTQTGAVPLIDLSVDPASRRPGQTTDLDYSGRSTSVSENVAWTHQDWTVRGSATYRRFDTHADTAFGAAAIPTPVFTLTSVSFESQEVVANLDVRHDFTKTLRAFVDATRTSVTGDYVARRLAVSVGAEHDLRKDVTLGLTVSTWRLVDETTPEDDYRTYGAEVSLTYRF